MSAAAEAFGRITAALVPGGDELSADMCEVMAAIEIAQVTLVLDGWAHKREAGSNGQNCRTHKTERWSDEWCCELAARWAQGEIEETIAEYWAPTAHAARAAAAKAIEAGEV